jgi:hypothetical protein
MWPPDPMASPTVVEVVVGGGGGAVVVVVLVDVVVAPRLAVVVVFGLAVVGGAVPPGAVVVDSRVTVVRGVTVVLVCGTDVVVIDICAAAWPPLPNDATAAAASRPAPTQASNVVRRDIAPVLPLGD